MWTIFRHKFFLYFAEKMLPHIRVVMDCSIFQLFYWRLVIHRMTFTIFAECNMMIKLSSFCCVNIIESDYIIQYPLIRVRNKCFVYVLFHVVGLTILFHKPYMYRPHIFSHFSINAYVLTEGYKIREYRIWSISFRLRTIFYLGH